MTYRAALLITLLGLPPVAAAQELRDTVEIRPIVVTATRVPIAVDATASAVTVVTGAELARRGIRTVAEVLRQVAGATVVETGAYGSLTSLFMRGGESDYVKVLLDGVPLNQPGGAFDFADLTTDNIERIEIVRGPVSVLYGSDAVTGVIQIFTRQGTGAARLSAGVVAGSHGTARVSAEAAGGAGKVGYTFGVSHFGSEGIYANNNDYRNTIASGKLRVVPDDRTEASLTYRYGDDVYHFPTNGAGQPVDSNQFSAARGPTFGLEVARWLTPAVEIRFLGGLREQRLRFSDEPDSPGEDGSFTSRDLVHREITGLLATWRAGRDALLTTGVEYEEESQRGRSVFQASFGTFPDSTAVRRTNAGYYAQALLGVGQPLAVTIGARLEENSRFGSRGTFRAGASWRLEEGTRVRGSLGTGIKEPTFFENFARGFVTGNPGLKPERSFSWEAGLEHALAGGRVTLSGTYFNQGFHNLIVYVPPPTASPNYANLAAADAQGVELEVETVPGRGVVAGVSYTYLDTRVVDGGGDPTFEAGKRLIRRPTNAADLRVGYRAPSRGSVTLDVQFVGDRDDRDFATGARVTLHPYSRINLAAEYTIVRPQGLTPGVTLVTRVENLGNDPAREIANFPTRGRTLMVGGVVRFGS
ncbi:MAG: TonB-dependent receptor [Gemmatimonadetes bacterium]|nr:TonB-dependent receptor [Gemmatimonadota bacterium]